MCWLERGFNVMSGLPGSHINVSVSLTVFVDCVKEDLCKPEAKCLWAWGPLSWASGQNVWWTFEQQQQQL
jgi:hypothetical protein